MHDRPARTLEAADRKGVIVMTDPGDLAAYRDRHVDHGYGVRCDCGCGKSGTLDPVTARVMLGVRPDGDDDSDPE
jgi:hypothetical protein